MKARAASEERDDSIIVACGACAYVVEARIVSRLQVARIHQPPRTPRFSIAFRGMDRWIGSVWGEGRTRRQPPEPNRGLPACVSSSCVSLMTRWWVLPPPRVVVAAEPSGLSSFSGRRSPFSSTLNLCWHDSLRMHSRPISDHTHVTQRPGAQERRQDQRRVVGYRGASSGRRRLRHTTATQPMSGAAEL